MNWLTTAAGVIALLGAVVAFFGLAFRAGYLWLEKEKPHQAVWHALCAFAILATLITMTAMDIGQDEEQGPCLHEATGYAYNPATKTTDPYTYCDQRGTWSK